MDETSNDMNTNKNVIVIMIEKMRFKFHHLVRSLAVVALVLGGGTALAAPVPQGQSGAVQASTVTGQVLDENGDPVIGATVSVKGTNVNAVTDFDGRFGIRADQGASLTVSYVGYGTQEVQVDGKTLTIHLKQDSQVLNEVVVTALGIKKEAKSLSYNVQQVEGDALMRVQCQVDQRQQQRAVCRGRYPHAEPQ